MLLGRLVELCPVMVLGMAVLSFTVSIVINISFSIMVVIVGFVRVVVRGMLINGHWACQRLCFLCLIGILCLVFLMSFGIFLGDRSLWKDYMDCAITCFNNYLPRMLKKMLRKTYELDVGLICVFHPFGKDMKFHPHLHLLITEGGFDKNGKFIKVGHFPAEAFRRCWQYVVLDKFQELGLPNGVATGLYSEYPKGFYVWVHKRGRIKHPKLVVRYVGRYVRHPAIANRRITSFDGRTVEFYCDYEGEIVDVVMSSEEFITALIQHVPPPHFKMVRYYGAYSRRRKGYFGARTQSSIKQLTLYKFGLIKPILCPYCRNELEFVWYLKKPPPQEMKTQQEITQYVS